MTGPLLTRGDSVRLRYEELTHVLTWSAYDGHVGNTACARGIDAFDMWTILPRDAVVTCLWCSVRRP